MTMPGATHARQVQGTRGGYPVHLLKWKCDALSSCICGCCPCVRLWQHTYATTDQPQEALFRDQHPCAPSAAISGTPVHNLAAVQQCSLVTSMGLGTPQTSATVAGHRGSCTHWGVNLYILNKCGPQQREGNNPCWLCAVSHQWGKPRTSKTGLHGEQPMCNTRWHRTSCMNRVTDPTRRRCAQCTQTTRPVQLVAGKAGGHRPNKQ
jgi:hypothetical protein